MWTPSINLCISAFYMYLFMLVIPLFVWYFQKKTPHVLLSPPSRVLILSPISARFLSDGGSTAVRRCSHCASLGGWGSVIPKIDSYRTASPRATSSYLFSLFQVPGVNVSEDFELFTWTSFRLWNTNRNIWFFATCNQIHWTILFVGERRVSGKICVINYCVLHERKIMWWRLV